MAVVTLSGDERLNIKDQPVSYGHSAVLKALAVKHFTAGAGDSATSTYYVGRIDLSARICPLSKVYFDDLASTGSPTFDIGAFPVDANFTADDDALNDGIDVAAAASGANGVAVIKDYAADSGKQLWEYISGLTENPGGFADIYITLKDAAVNTGGDVYIEIFGLVE